MMGKVQFECQIVKHLVASKKIKKKSQHATCAEGGTNSIINDFTGNKALVLYVVDYHICLKLPRAFSLLLNGLRIGIQTRPDH